LTPEKRTRVVVIMDNSESGDEVAAFMHSADGTYITADGKINKSSLIRIFNLFFLEEDTYFSITLA
jgi:hypothetical protein